jgi:nitroimidazol reductase NimA-like FMN-containing flavoprotein (pyridoxamine 5'-phosphate oxidase superfamily)
MTSSDTEESSHSSSAEIAPARCEELLAAHTMGRVAWQAPDGPLIIPVTYAYYAKMVVFRTSPYGVLSQLATRSSVAFEVDDVDPAASSGWSVLVRGSCEAITEPSDLVELWKKDGLVPWAAGVRNLFIAITPSAISGRTVKAPWAD